MSFLNPTYLWALLGFLIPIAIHLWSKKEGKTIKVGSIELLRESESKQTSSIKPNELWLLLLRLFILSLVTMILAEPQLKLESGNVAITHLIEPSLLKNGMESTILKSIDNASDIKILTTDFPEIDDIDLEHLSTETPNYWQLSKDMQNINSDSIVVFTKALASGFRGVRPSINKNINWIVIDTDEPAEKIPIKATNVDSDIELLSMQTNSKFTSFGKTLIKEKDYNDNLEIITENSVKVLLYSEDAFNKDSRFIEASLIAVSKHINRAFDVTKTQEINNQNFDDYNLVIWLSENVEAPKNINNLLEHKFDKLSTSLIVEGSSKNHYYLTNHLNTENSIKNYLPEQLLNILNLNSELDSIIEKADKRALSKTQIMPTFSSSKTKNHSINHLSISKWLWVILGITLLGERFIAAYRKQ